VERRDGTRDPDGEVKDFTLYEVARDTISAWIREDYKRLYVHSALVYQSLEE
jgi:putative transposase